MIVDVKRHSSINSEVEFYLPNVYHINSNSIEQDICQRFKISPKYISSIKSSLKYRIIDLFIPKECQKNKKLSIE